MWCRPSDAMEEASRGAQKRRGAVWTVLLLSCSLLHMDPGECERYMRLLPHCLSLLFFRLGVRLRRCRLGHHTCSSRDCRMGRWWPRRSRHKAGGMRGPHRSHFMPPPVCQIPHKKTKTKHTNKQKKEQKGGWNGCGMARVGEVLFFFFSSSLDKEVASCDWQQRESMADAWFVDENGFGYVSWCGCGSHRRLSYNLTCCRWAEGERERKTFFFLFFFSLFLFSFFFLFLLKKRHATEMSSFSHRWSAVILTCFCRIITRTAKGKWKTTTKKQKRLETNLLCPTTTTITIMQKRINK